MDVSPGRPHRASHRSAWVAWALLLVGVGGISVLSLRRSAMIPHREEPARSAPSTAEPGAALPESAQPEVPWQGPATDAAVPRREPRISDVDSIAVKTRTGGVVRERLTAGAGQGAPEWRSGFPQALLDVEPSITTPHRRVWILPDRTAVIYDLDADLHCEIRELTPGEIALMDELTQLQPMQTLDRIRDLGPAPPIPER